jgi:cellulose synthase/poly-beta-1,6-N-acetylglucosamine synthase-like glycosyltransferase
MAGHVGATVAWALRRGSLARQRSLARQPPVAPRHSDPSRAAGRDRALSVSVLVPAWNEALTIGACLASIRDLEYPNYETIVIAGGPDGSFGLAVEIARLQTGIRVLEQGPEGKNAALNLGLAAASGEVIALLDADSRVEPGWLGALVAPIQRSVAAATGRPVASRRTRITLAQEMQELLARHVEGSTTLQGSGGIALTREAIERVGGFPEDVVVGVDWDLDARLRAAGLDAAYCPDAVVHTERPATMREYWANEVRWRRAHLAGLLRLTAGGLLPLRSALAGLYLYGLAWFAAALTIASAITMVRGDAVTPLFWLVFVLWLLVRRVSLAVTVAAWSRDSRWLQLAWLPPLLLVVTLAASIPATLTLRRTSPHFRGPRPATSPDHAG